MIKKKVLVVEDDESIREAMKDLLETEGYTVECAVNGDEGIQALRRTGPLPGLVLLDMTMPVKDGFQFRSEQEEDHKLAVIPVVVMTADGNIEAKMHKIGAKDFIKKPFDIDLVVKTVARYCL